MTAIILGTLGGTVSLLSTSIGALGSAFMPQNATGPRWKLSIDFALGLMVSAAAFSLIGPALIDARNVGKPLAMILLMAALGVAFVLLLKAGVENVAARNKISSSHLVLATVLMLHNFPEGLATGAAVAGLGWTGALPILGGIAVQNVPEGALMVICLRSFGWSNRWALVGGIGSGLVEMLGGTFAGALLDSVQGALPYLLSFTGGVMISSVAVELFEDSAHAKGRIWSRQFAVGLLALPLLQFIGF